MKLNCLKTNNKNVPYVVITNISNRVQYYQWFIYGLMLLKKEGKIKLKFDVPFGQNMLLVPHIGLFVRILNKISRIWGSNVEVKNKAYLKGYIVYSERRRNFCIDSADSPNMFSGELLKNMDIYFKIQCPKVFDPRGFKLGNEYIPFFDVEFDSPKDNGKLKAKRKLCPEVYQYQDKIKPLLSAVSSMGSSCAFADLDNRYKHLLRAREIRQTEKAMCYFGNSKGPKPSKDVVNPDFDWESDIMCYLGDKINHPNEKRARIADIMSSLGTGFDARIINRDYSDTGKKVNNELIVPLKEFSNHVARFQYNVNVSGYRMSIPARFIDSFICGTAIATDNLSVKWYEPFKEEVSEIGEMGYLPDREVDYEGIKEKIKNLKPVSREYVINRYEKFWSPKAVAIYIVTTLLNY